MSIAMTSGSANSPRTFVAYLRVSTGRQGRSGLGLEAQRSAVDAFLRPGDVLLARRFTEVESGKKAARPALAEAIALCRATGAILLVAKLDRLSRNVPFLRSLIDGDVGVAFGDMPHVPAGAMGRFILTQMAAVAELEAGLISERTKAALAEAKKRGVKLGGDRGYRPTSIAQLDPKAGGRASALVRSGAANRAAFQASSAIRAARDAGATSLHQIAAALTTRGIATPSGSGAWTATAVRRVLARLDRIAA